MSEQIRAFVVDDEPLAVSRLVRLLDDTGRVDVAGTSTDSIEAVHKIAASGCDVVFLDIEMPGMNGFELLGKLQPQPLVVFTTAYSQYALQAFEVNSIDYLLKPIDAKQLDRALTKLDRIRGGAAPRPQVQQLLEQLASALPAGKAQYPNRLPSRIGDRIEFVDLARVSHFYASDKLTYASSAKRDYVVDFTMTELEDKLDPGRWVRVHRSSMINLDYIHELHPGFAGGVIVRLKDEKRSEVTVSRDRLQRLKDKLGL